MCSSDFNRRFSFVGVAAISIADDLKEQMTQLQNPVLIPSIVATLLS